MGQEEAHYFAHPSELNIKAIPSILESVTRTSRLWSGILISSTVARPRVILGRGNAVVDVTSRQQVLSMSSVGGRHRYSYKYIVSYVHFPTSILPTSPTQDMTANCTKAGRRSTAIADVITYRHEDQMVYVPLDSNWAVGLDRFWHFFVGSHATCVESATACTVRICDTRKD